EFCAIMRGRCMDGTDVNPHVAGGICGVLVEARRIITAKTRPSVWTTAFKRSFFMGQRKNRRQFLQHSALAGIGFWVAGGLTRAESKSPNERLRIAGIGVGGKGSSDIGHYDKDGNLHGAAKFGDVVALCDIDENHLNAKAKEFPHAKKY